MPSAPHTFAWTAHARQKAAAHGIVPADVETLVRENHRRRQRNAGAGRWRITAGRVVVIYDQPVDADHGRARVITIWRR